MSGDRASGAARASGLNLAARANAAERPPADRGRHSDGGASTLSKKLGHLLADLRLANHHRRREASLREPDFQLLSLDSHCPPLALLKLKM